MSDKRKLWCTEYTDTTIRNYCRHESKAAVYRYVQAEVANYLCASPERPHRIAVRIDERDGAGWCLYEVLDLAELAKIQEATP